MPHDPNNPWLSRLEPEANRISVSDPCKVSIAISLKRIADSMDQLVGRKVGHVVENNQK